MNSLLPIWIRIIICSIQRNHCSPTFQNSRFALPTLYFLLALLTLFSRAAHANTESFWGAQEFYTRNGGVRYLLLFPPHYDPHRKYELWLNLHGSPGCAGHAIYQYRESAAQHAAFLLAPQADGWSALAYERPDGKKDLYRAWDMRRDKARILLALDEVESRYPIDRKRIALLGFSAGCEMGRRLLAERPETFYFFGGVANGFKRGKPPASTAGLRRAARHVPHFYAAGKADGFAGPMFARTAHMLRADGFELRTAFPAGIGHDLPPVIQTPLLAFMDEVRARQQPADTGPRSPAPRGRRRVPRSAIIAVLLIGAGAAGVGYRRRLSRRPIRKP